MTRTEAIALAEQLSTRDRPTFVIYDKELKHYFISDGEGFDQDMRFYEDSPYEIVVTLRDTWAKIAKKKSAKR